MNFQAEDVVIVGGQTGNDVEMGDKYRIISVPG